MRRLGLLIAVAATTTCSLDRDFQCEGDVQCREGLNIGQCQPEGFCSFADEQCESGQRFGEHADGDFARECVPVRVGSSGATLTVGDDDDDDDDASDDDDDDDASDDDDDASDDDDDDVTTSGDDDDDDVVETAGGPEDPYGRCDEGCGFEGATCLEAMDGARAFRMCSPPCDVTANPSSECPGSLDTSYAVGCLETGPGGPPSCFIVCNRDTGECPGEMVCALGMVCSWL